MYKFLVVDDEPLLRKDIIMLLNRGNIPCRSIIEAENGFEAMKAIDTDTPDIALVDIRMPGMSGLELVEQIQQNYPAIQVIIVSGYADFSYARDALRFGVLDYILKPVEDDKFYDCVQKAICEIDDRNNRLSSDEIEEFIYRTVFSKQKTLSESAKSKDILKDNYFKMAVFLCNNSNSKYSQDEMMFNLCNLLYTTCKSIYGAAHFKNKIKQNEIILVTWDTNPDKASQNLEDITLVIWDIISSYTNNCTIVGIGTENVEADSLPFLYQSCHEALKKRFLEEGFYDIYRHGGTEASSRNTELFARLTQTIDTINKLAGYPDKIIDTLFSKATLQQLTIHQLKSIFSQLITVIIPVSDLDVPTITGNILDNFNSIDEIRNYLYNLYKTTREVADIKDISESIPEICAFIKANYNKELSLTLLAEKYNINPNYLSEIFKEKTGVNFKDYLADARLEVAKDLLKSTNMSIKNIALAIGYNSQGYFQKVFKKQCDITPMDYRATFSQ